jgi:inosine/xanthosine triphosphate pyrophosphatase family protein
VLRPRTKACSIVEENGATFCENALIKARAVFLRPDTPLADDSGLLSMRSAAPGCFSARYAGETRRMMKKSGNCRTACKYPESAARSHFLNAPSHL